MLPRGVHRPSISGKPFRCYSRRREFHLDHFLVYKSVTTAASDKTHVMQGSVSIACCNCRRTSQCCCKHKDLASSQTGLRCFYENIEKRPQSLVVVQQQYLKYLVPGTAVGLSTVMLVTELPLLLLCCTCVLVQPFDPLLYPALL